MMEIELKYSIPDKETAERIWQDQRLFEMSEVGSREKLPFKAAYFDTEDGVLSSNDIAFRVRLEGQRVVASLKWNGKNKGPLHTREEINVPIDGANCLMTPDPEIFKESDTGKHMMELLTGKRLMSVMEVGFLRSRTRIDTGESIIEVSIDIGEIITDNGSESIRELELELFSGKHDDLLRLGAELAERYPITPETRSKYARGLSLAGKILVTLKLESDT